MSIAGLIGVLIASGIKKVLKKKKIKPLKFIAPTGALVKTNRKISRVQVFHIMGRLSKKIVALFYHKYG